MTMTLREVYEKAVEIGVDNYPGGAGEAERKLESVRERYQTMAEEPRARFDRERLRNPFGDTRMVNLPDFEFDTVLTGIDIYAPEVLLAAELRRRYPRLAVIAHHAVSFGRRGLGSVEDTIWTLAVHMESIGIPRAEAESMVWEWIAVKEAESAARLADVGVLQMVEALELPVATVHGPCDVCFESEMHSILARCSTLQEAVDGLSASPEMAYSGPELGEPYSILLGEPDAKLAPVWAPIAVGWRPSLKMVEAALKRGIRTVLVVLAPPEYVALAKAYGANLISVPHHMTDCRGMRLIYDQVFAGRDIRIIPCSNYRHLPH